VDYVLGHNTMVRVGIILDVAESRKLNRVAIYPPSADGRKSLQNRTVCAGLAESIPVSYLDYFVKSES
jgi:hypothetical protein